MSKVRHSVDNHILVMLYYSLIYPFLTYGVHVWGLTLPSFLTQLFIIQKKAIRIISFSEPKSHSEPLFKSLNLQSSMISLNHRYSILFTSGHADCYPRISVNISNLLLLFIPIQRGNHVIEIFM